MRIERPWGEPRDPVSESRVGVVSNGPHNRDIAAPHLQRRGRSPPQRQPSGNSKKAAPMSPPVAPFTGRLTTKQRHAWAELFDLPQVERADAMAARAQAVGLAQDDRKACLVWRDGGDENCRWAFVDDPTDISQVRAVYADDDCARSPACYVVVRQPNVSPAGTPYGTRGDTIFDIFRISAESSLWHHNRVYTRRK